MSAAVIHEASRDYYAHMQCDAGDGWVPRAISQIGSWLREKNWDVDLETPALHTRDDATLTIQRADDRTGHDYRMLLQESNTGSEWTTELHLHDEPSGDDWITLAVRNDSGRFVNVPRLARYLMEVLPLRDGAVELTPGRHQWGVDKIDRLIALLSDPARHGLVFVAGTDATSGIPVEAFSRQVELWAREVVGLAQVVVLDPEGTAALEARVGVGFRAPSWTIRTYHPGVQFSDPRDWRRHRILGTARLAHQGDSTIQRLLGEIARGQAATRPVDSAVLRAHRRLERHENRRLLDVLEAPVDVAPAMAPLVVPDVDLAAEAPLSQTEAEVALVRRVLGVDEITELSLLRFAEAAVLAPRHLDVAHALQLRIVDLQQSFEKLQDERLELLEVLQDSQMETEVISLDLDGANARVRYLTDRLKERRDYEAEHTATPDEYANDLPTSFDGLLECVAEMNELEFTGDPSEVERLNQLDTNDAALRTAWCAVLALRDYVRARGCGDCTQGLQHYIAHTPSGYQTFVPGKFGETETGITMRSFGKERLLPVPENVHPRGRVEMKAHFKLARIGMASPRMYIYDGHPDIPKVFIGYIGVHLTNTQTR